MSREKITEERRAEVGLIENGVPTPSKLRENINIQKPKNQLVLTVLLGGSELEANDVPGGDVAFDVTLNLT